MHPVILSKEWMYIFNAVFSKSSISNMTKKNFAYIRNVFFLKSNVIFIFWMFFKLQINTLVYLRKDILYGLSVIRANSTYVALSWFYVHFNASQTSTILTTVVLFLHH